MQSGSQTHPAHTSHTLKTEAMPRISQPSVFQDEPEQLDFVQN